MKQKITADTVIISAFSMVLQLLSIALNIVITKNMGESAVGILSLVSQFFVFALTLSNGNIFSVSSRFISEEIGRKGNVEKVISYCLFSGVGLSLLFSVMLFFLAKKIADAIKAVGQEGGYVYIFDLNATQIPFVNETLSIDVTSAVKAKLGLQ